MNNADPFEVIESEQVPGAKFEVVQYKALKGSKDLNTSEKVFLPIRQASI